ncbi:MAG: tRNA pseudouridine(13) synthase TruD, partial [Dokdonella sp.]
GKADPDWSSMDIEGVKVLDARRHDRKLKRGVHRSNRFRIRLRDITGDRDAAKRRVEAITAQGVPNYFGEQRFGRGGGNLDLARSLFSGRRMPRDQKSFALSAARSHLFNRILAARVANGSWNQPRDGDVFMLAGTHSVFGPESIDDALHERMNGFDIHPTGAMWGKGDLRSVGEVAALESLIALADAELADGLIRNGLDQQRRSLRLLTHDLQATWEHDALILDFSLESGAFATVVIRELCDTGARVPTLSASDPARIE